MADRAVIMAAPRTVLGKQVKQLRREGRLPANVYGKGIASTAIDLEAREFTRNIKATRPPQHVRTRHRRRSRSPAT